MFSFENPRRRKTKQNNFLSFRRVNRPRAAFRENEFEDEFRNVGGCFVLRQPRARVSEHSAERRERR